jgi:transposase
MQARKPIFMIQENPHYSSSLNATENIRNKIIELSRRKVPVSEIAKRLELSKPTVRKYCVESGVKHKKAIFGRPAKLSTAAAVTLCSSFLRQKAKSLDEGKEIIEKKFKISVSKATVRRCLLKNKLKCHIKAKKPLLTERHKAKRMEFVSKFSHYSFFDWKDVIWSDECKFALTNTNNREYYWKRRSDPLQDAHVKKTLKFGGGSIMAWACITSKGVGRIVRINGIMNAEKYIDILEEGLIGTMEDHELLPSSSLFMQDNDPKHTARKTKEWLSRNQINVLDWPAQSPDMNPIENLWNIVDQRLRKRERKPANVDELWEMVKLEWKSINKEVIRDLYLSMTARIAALKKAKGGYTKY